MDEVINEMIHMEKRGEKRLRRECQGILRMSERFLFCKCTLILMKILSYNIKGLWVLKKKKKIVAPLIKDKHLDILCIQEIKS